MVLAFNKCILLILFTFHAISQNCLNQDSRREKIEGKLREALDFDGSFVG
jgi:hypothetical protein